MFDGKYLLFRSARRTRVGFRVNDEGVLEIHAPENLPEEKEEAVSEAKDYTDKREIEIRNTKSRKVA